SAATALYPEKPKDVDKVELVARGENMVFKKDGESWKIIEPIQAPANEYEVNSVVDGVTNIKYVKSFEKSSSDRPSDEVSGLAKPNAVVKLYSGDKLQAEVNIGNKVPTGTGSYIRTGNSDAILQANTD